MSKKKLFVCTVAALLLFAGGICRLHAAAESVVDVMDQKLKVEAQMEAKVKQVLASYVGTREIIAVVRLGLVDREAASEKGGNTVRKWDENEELVLPGVPATASMTKKTSDTPKDKNLRNFRLSRIDVSLLIGKKLNQERQDKVKALVTAMFNLSADAGDTLVIDTYRPPSTLFGARQAWMVLALLTLAILILFLFGPVKAVLKTLNATLPSMGIAHNVTVKNSGKEKSGDELEDELDDKEIKREMTIIPGGMIAAGGPAGPVEESIDFTRIITKNNIEDLRLILTHEPPKVIAMVVQRLPLELAFIAIPEKKMAEVITQFTHVKYEDPQIVKDTLREIRTKVEWSFGGPMKLARMLQAMDHKLQENALTLLGDKYPDFAMQVERRLFRFLDLLYYEETALKRIYRKAGVEPFAKCLKGCADDVAHLFYQKLGPNITDIITNYMKTMIFVGGSTEAENRILQAVDDLNKRGLIQSIEEIKDMQEKMETWNDTAAAEEAKREMAKQKETAVKEHEQAAETPQPPATDAQHPA